MPAQSPRHRANHGSPPPALTQKPPLRSRRWIAVTLTVMILAAGGLAADWWQSFPEDAPRTFVGKSRCMECHQQQVHDWENSHHALAMQRATAETVLAPPVAAPLMIRKARYRNIPVK